MKSTLISAENIGDVGVIKVLPQGIVTTLLPGSIFDEKTFPVDVAMAQLIVFSVFAAVLSETDEVRKESGIFLSYALSSIDRLDKGEDTGILYRESMSIWRMLDESQRESVLKLVSDSCRALEEFPDVSTMKVVDTFRHSHVDVGDIELDVLFPALVTSSRGVNAIIPILGYNSAFSSLYGDYSYISGVNVSQVHLWDIESMSISLAQRSHVPLWGNL